MSDQQAGDATTRFECRIRSQVYDPPLGDDLWQIQPGTAFEDLPASWRCPKCAAEKGQLVPIDEASKHA